MSAINGQKLKLLWIMRILEEETDAERGLSMPQIIDRLSERGIHAERKGIYRDIESLRETGVKIITHPRRPVEYALVREGLGLDEIMLLVDVVQSSKFLSENKSTQLVRALKGLVSKREAKLLNKRVHVEGRIKSQHDSVFHAVNTIHQAMQQKRRISFLYYRYDVNMQLKAQNDEKAYEVTPVKLIFQDGQYYLAAFSEKDDAIRNYRVDRMRIVQVSEQKATSNDLTRNYAFERIESQEFGMFQGEKSTITLRVEEPLMGAVADRFGGDALLVSSHESTEDAPAYALLRVTVQVSPQFFGWLAGLNGGVLIETPSSVASQYEEWLLKLASAYSQKK